MQHRSWTSPCSSLVTLHLSSSNSSSNDRVRCLYVLYAISTTPTLHPSPRPSSPRVMKPSDASAGVYFVYIYKYIYMLLRYDGLVGFILRVLAYFVLYHFFPRFFSSCILIGYFWWERLVFSFFFCHVVRKSHPTYWRISWSRFLVSVMGGFFLSCFTT